MLKINESNYERTCCECGEEITRGHKHFELWGGPETNYDGRRNGWVQFAHINCVRRAASRPVVRAKIAELNNRHVTQQHEERRFWRS